MKNHANLTLILSILFLLITGAFTMAPNTETKKDYYSSIISEEITNLDDGLIFLEFDEAILEDGCHTCTFSGGTPSGCRDAGYCGMTGCENSCELSGILCGDCVNDSRY